MNNAGQGVAVIKVGTSTIAGNAGLDGRFLLHLASTIADVIDAGWRLVVVTSGAVGAGRWRLGIPKPASIAGKQAAAAVGQGLLMHAYESLLAPLGIATAQLLLTRADLGDRQRYLNAKTTLQALLSAQGPVVPIINENDSIATDELKFGDNDTLSALVAALVDADWLIILTDVEGLYDRPPGQAGAQLIPDVAAITPEIEALAGPAAGTFGTGGMQTKLAAARIATSSGIPVALLLGSQPRAVIRVLAGEPVSGTVFRARGDRLEARRRWLAFGRPLGGCLRLDRGAAEAVCHGGKSLLPAGIVAVAGEFEAGEAVSLVGPDGRELARGACSYSAADVARILGRHTSEIEGILGFKVTDEVVHHNNLVLM